MLLGEQAPSEELCLRQLSGPDLTELERSFHHWETRCTGVAWIAVPVQSALRTKLLLQGSYKGADPAGTAGQHQELERDASSCR